MPAQPTTSSQNTGLVVIVVGIFMVIIAFLAVTYLNSGTIQENQKETSQQGKEERADLVQVTCALWNSVGEPGSVDTKTLTQVEALCGTSS